MHKRLSLTLAIVCLMGAVATAQEGTLSTFDGLRAQIDVTPNELRWQQVAWRPLLDGVATAQRQDRPIFYWIYFGDPRGGC